MWNLAWACLREATADEKAKADPPRSLALSCQGEAVMPVDAQGRALRPAILGMDTRTVGENQRLCELFGADELFPAHRHAGAHDQHAAQAAVAAGK